MRKALILLTLLAGCSREPEPGNGQAVHREPRPQRTVGQLRSLTGLYESGDRRSPSQLCIIQRRRSADFGLVIRGPGTASCAGSGTVRRIGRRLRFTMAGESRCTLNATIDHLSIVMPASAPRGCAYYCGSPARPTNVRLTRNGGTKDAALRAKDPVGEPLCSGESGSGHKSTSLQHRRRH
ncbi:hypothetical protein [Sphingomonas sp.]|uniref:hypothetical protein n=1 Tax=Sphingomonas sp. TaxID=28214 RepID=UPI002FC8930C